MPWTGPNFIRHNEDYSGATVWQSDAAASILIQSVRHDYHDFDIANGIDACLNKNGANSPTANIDWGGFKTTNHGAGAAATDVAIFGQTITAASLDSGTNVLTLTRATGGDVTVDLSALAVGGSTSDFARYSNALNPFQGSAYFAGAAGVGLKNILTILDPLTLSGTTYTWFLEALTSTTSEWANTAGATFGFSGNAGAATLKVNGATVWTTASLPASTFTGVLTQTGGPYTVTGTWAINAPWTFTSPNLKLPAFLWSAGVGGTTWNAGPIDATTLAFTDPSGLSPLLYVIDAAPIAGAYLQIGPTAKRVWDQGSLRVLASGTPTGGEANNLALVLTGGTQGLWCNVSGTWTKIIAGP